MQQGPVLGSKAQDPKAKVDLWGLDKQGKAKRKMKKQVNGSRKLASLEQSAGGFLTQKDDDTAGVTV